MKMAVNDVKSLSAEIRRTDLEEILLGLAKSINQHVKYAPLPKEANLDDFFHTFPEGDRELKPIRFFVQNRIKPKGRVGIRYKFGSIDCTDGVVGFSVFDNGEGVPQESFDAVYSTLRKYVVDKGLKIIDETLKKEY